MYSLFIWAPNKILKFEVMLIKLKSLFLGFKVIEVDTDENAPLVLAMVSSIGSQPVLGKIILKDFKSNLFQNELKSSKIIFYFLTQTTVKFYASFIANNPHNSYQIFYGLLIANLQHSLVDSGLLCFKRFSTGSELSLSLVQREVAMSPAQLGRRVR